MHDRQRESRLIKWTQPVPDPWTISKAQCLMCVWCSQVLRVPISWRLLTTLAGSDVVMAVGGGLCLC
jgi:hypothetical protein